MNYFIIAGEASGDLHASHLIEHLSRVDAEAQFCGLGGDKMNAAGCKLLLHYRDMAFMGYVDVIRHLGKIRRNMQLAKQAILAQHPDVLILIDYPSFNLQIAKFVKRKLPSTRIYYYIPPKVWAWKTWRIHKIARLTDKVFCIFPFEPAFYAQYGYQTEYVGNPTATEIRRYLQTADSDGQPAAQSQQSAFTNKLVIALLPGSRWHEIEQCLPRMLTAALSFRDYKVVIATAPAISRSTYDKILNDIADSEARDRITLTDETYPLLQHATAAVVNSGTATLETALLGCPQVAVYHLAFGHVLNALRPIMFKIPYFTLPNLIAGRQVIRELLAYEFTSDAVRNELERLLHDDAYRGRQQTDYENIKRLLGGHDAPAQAAARIVSDVRS